MNMDTDEIPLAITNDDPVVQLGLLARDFKCRELAAPVLDNPKFAEWSACSMRDDGTVAHHYGTGGLAQHTFEVTRLALNVNATMGGPCAGRDILLACLYHDIGKLRDYEPSEHDTKKFRDDPPKIVTDWVKTKHKRQIHHIARGAIDWEIVAYMNPSLIKDANIDVEAITHAILSHHGLREWGSPVAPDTKLAWILHLCDGLSARLNDCGHYHRIPSLK